MAKAWCSTAQMPVKRGRAVSRKISVVCFAQRGGLQKSGYAAAPRGVRLLHVNCAGFQHSAEVPKCIAIFAGRYLHGRRGVLAHLSQPLDIVRRNRLLEPAHVLARGEDVRQILGLLAAIGAVCIDEQPGGSYRRFRKRDSRRIAGRIATDLHLDPLTTFDLYPTGELATELIIVVAGKAAAAVNGDGFAIPA